MLSGEGGDKVKKTNEELLDRYKNLKVLEEGYEDDEGYESQMEAEERELEEVKVIKLPEEQLALTDPEKAILRKPPNFQLYVRMDEENGRQTSP